MYLSFIRLKLVSSLSDHVLADGANVIVVDGKVVLLPDGANAMAGGLGKKQYLIRKMTM